MTQIRSHPVERWTASCCALYKRVRRSFTLYYRRHSSCFGGRKKKPRKPRRERLPDVRSDEDCRRLIATLEKPVYRGCFTLIYAYGFWVNHAGPPPLSS